MNRTPLRRAGSLLAALGLLFVLLETAPPCRAEDAWTANLACGTNVDGRLEVFDVDRNGDLRHRWQRESLHDWSGWSILGGPFLPGVAVVNDETGRLAVFAVDRSEGVVMYNMQREPNSPAWSNWTRLSGPVVRAPLAAAQDANGRIELFAVEADGNSVAHIWQNDARDGWSDWKTMGGDFWPWLAVARNKTGQIEVFASGRADHLLAHCWQVQSNSPDSWTAWTGLDQPILSGFSIGQSRDGRLEVFGANATNGFVMRSYQVAASPETAWSHWQSLGIKMKPVIAVGQTHDGRLEIFAVSPTNSMIYHALETRNDVAANWGGWTDMSLVGGTKVAQIVNTNSARLAAIGGWTRSYPVLGKGMEGDMEIFAYDERLDDVLNYRRHIGGNLQWTDWLALDHATSEYLSRAWRTDDGLPDNRVQAIAQTTDGYLWVGTRNGLSRFDGVRFVTQPVKTMFGWTNPSVTALCVDHQRGLWVGSESEGAARLAEGNVTTYGVSNGLAGDAITAITAASDRSIWIGTASGLSHYQAGRFQNYTVTNGLVWNDIRAVLEDSAGSVWATTGGGLNIVRGNHIDTFTRTNGLPDNSVTGLWQDVPGRMWIGSDHGLIFNRIDQFYAYDRRYGLTDRLTTAIRSDSQGNIWVGNNTGLSQFKDGRFSEVFDQEGNPFGKINTLFEDRDANMWAGSQDGLYRITPKRLLFYGRKQQLTQDNITSVLEDPSGSIWIGTWGGGLDQLKNETITGFDPANGFRFDLITALAKSQDGGVWVSGPYGTGVVQLRRGSAAYSTSRSELTNTAVRVLLEDHSGNLWIGASHGVACLQGRDFVTNGLTQALEGRPVNAICESPDDTLWVGTESGLYAWKDAHLRQFTHGDGLSDNAISALYIDTKNDIWIGTRYTGLTRFSGGRFFHYAAPAGLFSSEIFEIVEDDFGWLWMSCSKGVFRVSKKNLADFDLKKVPSITCIAYGHDDGMESVVCGTGKPGAWKSRDGILWFPTGKGLVAIDPRILQINRTPPPVYVEEIVADQHSIPATGAEITVPPGRGALEFHYTAPSFQRPEKIRFQYRLEGIDPDWIDAGTRRAAYYNHLSPGHYHFRVKACNSDGVWNETGATLHIFLAPHFWQAAWFQLLAGSAVIGMVAGTARQMTKRRMQRKLVLVEQKHAIERERLRIARDIHDDLGGSLTQIALLGELAMGTLNNPSQAVRHLAKITDSARLNVRALDEIVWAVHPGNDTLYNLVLYLWQFAEEFFSTTQMRCRVEAPANVPDHPLSSDLRHNIFLLAKEAFNNTVKHSHATEVRLRFTVGPRGFVMSIEDNGRGFDVTAVNGSGNGLRNMNQRARDIGGTIELTSTTGRGSCISFVLPLQNKHEAN
jgi:ligand-binding sensor domain-containing protein/signal transduction histidine kinase